MFLMHFLIHTIRILVTHVDDKTLRITTVPKISSVLGVTVITDELSFYVIYVQICYLWLSQRYYNQWNDDNQWNIESYMFVIVWFPIRFLYNYFIDIW